MVVSQPSAPQEPTLSNDKALAPFLADTFDPATFLNSALPAWQTPPSIRSQHQPSPLGSLPTQTQALVSQLTAQLNRLSAQLTKATDEILRSGSRLAYETDVLRGDAASLGDALTSGLRADIARLAPPPQTDETSASPAGPASAQLRRLQTLALVRARLESVVQAFGAASDWPLAPSEVSLKASFITVAGPAAGDAEKREAAGRAFAERTRAELADLAGRDADGARAALARVERLRELAEVWRGTAEEKARLRFVDGLAKMVEERRRGGGGGGGYGVRAEGVPSRAGAAGARR